MKTVKTEKGSILPLTNLKGKDYLMVAYRIQWFCEQVSNFTIDTEFLKLESDYAVARATVSIYNEAGNVIRRATATKREDQKHFADYAEKAETSAIGRALAMLGFGTQFAVADLDEGSRIVDSPVVDVKEAKKAVEASPVEIKTEVKVEATPVKKSTFRKPSATSPTKEGDNGHLKQITGVFGPSGGWE